MRILFGCTGLLKHLRSEHGFRSVFTRPREWVALWGVLTENVWADSVQPVHLNSFQMHRLFYFSLPFVHMIHFPTSRPKWNMLMLNSSLVMSVTQIRNNYQSMVFYCLFYYYFCYYCYYYYRLFACFFTLLMSFTFFIVPKWFEFHIQPTTQNKI